MCITYSYREHCSVLCGDNTGMPYTFFHEIKYAVSMVLLILLRVVAIVAGGLLEAGLVSMCGELKWIPSTVIDFYLCLALHALELA